MLRFMWSIWLVILALMPQVSPNSNTGRLDLSASLDGVGGIGGLLARTDAGGSTFYHADGAGNVTGLMDGSQNVAARYLYGPFGNLIRKSG